MERVLEGVAEEGELAEHGVAAGGVAEGGSHDSVDGGIEERGS